MRTRRATAEASVGAVALPTPEAAGAAGGAVPPGPVPRSRWFIACAVLPPVAAVVITDLAPSPNGHWVEHLSAVGFKLTQLVVLLGLALMLGRRRLPRLLIVLLVLASTGIVLQSYGDLRVAHSIWRTSGDPGIGTGYEAGHDASGLGDLVVLLAGFAFAIAAGTTRRIRPALALLAAVLVLIPPPFLWPAVGILFVLLHGLTTGRSMQPSTPSDEVIARAIGHSTVEGD